jgi:hypothetical protein
MRKSMPPCSEMDVLARLPDVLAAGKKHLTLQRRRRQYSQIFQSFKCPRTDLKVNFSGVASPRSRSIRSRMTVTSDGVRKDLKPSFLGRAAWSGKSKQKTSTTAAITHVASPSVRENRQ